MPFRKHEGLDASSPRHPKHAVWLAQQARWRHNGHLGSIRMATMNIAAIQRSPTTTNDCKKLANKIEGLLWELEVMMKTRKPGT